MESPTGMNGPAAGDLLSIVRARLGFLVLNVAAVTLVALALSLVLPKWYSARAVLLPPTEDDSGSMISQLMPRGIVALRASYKADFPGETSTAPRRGQSST